MGLSLDEIKNIIENYTSPESVLHIIRKQKAIIDEKIKELNKIKDNITFLEESIKVSLDEGLNKIFIKFYEDRSFIKYDNTNRFTEEFEVNLEVETDTYKRKYRKFVRYLKYIYVESFKNGKHGEAIMNRLVKAAGHKIIHV